MEVYDLDEFQRVAASGMGATHDTVRSEVGLL